MGLLSLCGGHVIASASCLELLSARSHPLTVDAVDTGQILLLHPHAALSRFAPLAARR